MSRPFPEFIPPWTRPIRIPQPLEITHTAPPFAIAGKTASWRVPFKLSKDVPGEADLRVQLWGGRNNKGVFYGAQIEKPGADGYIAAELEDGTQLSMQASECDGTYALSLPAGGLRKGQTLTLVLGDRSAGGAGITASRDHVFNKFFVLYVLPASGTGDRPPPWAGGLAWAGGAENQIVSACTMHILGGNVDRLRVYAPSTVRPGQTFHVLIRPEDELGNLSSQNIGALSLAANGVPLAPTVERIPDSTCMRAALSLSAEGVHRLRVFETSSGIAAVTNPVVCSRTALPTYWGMIHGHTEMSDGTGALNHYFHQLKNEVMLDFVAPGDHDHLWETPDAYWRTTCEAVRRWHVPGEFVTFLGYEWAKWRRNGDGDRNVYYFDDDRPLYRSDDGEYATPPELFAALRESNEKAIIIPHHTGHGGNFCDWKDHSPEHERLAEIYQIRGSYECAEEDDNPVPEKGVNCPPYPDGYVRNALALGWRVGFTAGGDDHLGHWGTEYRFETGYKQGLMSVQAAERTRGAIFEAMYGRRTVATTGARVLLSYDVGGKPMGCELSVTRNPELAFSRKVSIEFHGTAPVQRIDIVRNNHVVHSTPSDGEMDVNIVWEDTEPVGKTWLPPTKFCEHPFTFYYVRAVQTDGEVAWASPVWIDP
jgi:Protein of unknown function (DUF3604)